MDKKNPSLILLQEYLSPKTTEENKPAEASSPQVQGQPPPFDQMPAILEAILLTTEAPIKLELLNHILENPGKMVVLDALRQLQRSWSEEKRGFSVIEVAEGWQIRTNPIYAQWIQKTKQGKPKKLSKASLEVLAIVAYRQPVTRSEIDQIRGVDSSAVIGKLIQAQLIINVGRREEDPGKPMLLGTTEQFLSLFNLRDLLELPTLKDLYDFQEGKKGTPNPKID